MCYSKTAGYTDQIRIGLEAEAILGILALCKSDQVELLSSDALVYETEQNPLSVRKEHARAVLAKSREKVSLTADARTRAEQLVMLNFKPMDAPHLALAELGEAEYFCTCDDRLLRKARNLANLRVKVVSPLELVQEIEK
jgi:predicted nucleic acid-binding protein